MVVVRQEMTVKAVLLKYHWHRMCYLIDF